MDGIRHQSVSDGKGVVTMDPLCSHLGILQCVQMRCHFSQRGFLIGQSHKWNSCKWPQPFRTGFFHFNQLLWGLIFGFCLQRQLMRHQKSFLLICHYVFVTMRGINWLGVVSSLVMALDDMGFETNWWHPEANCSYLKNLRACWHADILVWQV